MGNSTASAAAEAAMADIFAGMLMAGGLTFASFERGALAEGHAIMARAMGRALERLDAALCAELPPDLRVHDVRERSLATVVGDVSFRWRRLRARDGGACVPLADELDLPWGARVSPAAEEFLVEAGAEVSYAAAARLLARAGGSRVSAKTVMAAVHAAGERCAEEDARAARDLFDLGIKPGGRTAAEQVCVEADGTWVALQGTAPGEPSKVEIKAVAAYSGKVERGRKVAREHCVRHGCACAPGEFWPEAVAAIGSEFDLSALERVHLGTDGEGWCKRGGAYFPLRVEVAGHLDPFHVDRALLSCFDDAAMGWQLVEVVNDGGKEAAAALLEACIGMGLARKGAPRVLAYLRRNADLIAAEGPSLGTMESENQHLYKSRMASVPCAWSRPGASHMARLRSRRGSGRAVPPRTRAGSATPLRRRRDEGREMAALERGGLSATGCPPRVGSGYEPPRASVASSSGEVRYAAAVDSGMAGIGW